LKRREEKRRHQPSSSTPSPPAINAPSFLRLLLGQVVRQKETVRKRSASLPVIGRPRGRIRAEKEELASIYRASSDGAEGVSVSVELVPYLQLDRLQLRGLHLHLYRSPAARHGELLREQDQLRHQLRLPFYFRYIRRRSATRKQHARLLLLPSAAHAGRRVPGTISSRA
jgi:hypothetical protein